MAEQRPESVAIPLVFVNVDETPVHFVNQFVVSFQQDEFLMALGQLIPPMLLGDVEERRQQAEKLDSVPIKVVARVAMTRTRMGELVELLQGQLGRYDEQLEKAEEAAEE